MHCCSCLACGFVATAVRIIRAEVTKNYGSMQSHDRSKTARLKASSITPKLPPEISKNKSFRI